jgi:hypothetical protein
VMHMRRLCISCTANIPFTPNFTILKSVDLHEY